MKLTIWGAAKQVTGSMHLLQTDHYNILIDCGLDYEKNTKTEENIRFPFNPADIDVVVLTHAHIDHSGNLPTLIRFGFEGQILCTSPTADLAGLLLYDAVNIFLAKMQPKRRGKRKMMGAQPLYLQTHVSQTISKMVTLAFNRPFKINNNIELTFVPVGHILGAAAAIFKINENNTQKTIAFTGDVGRKDYPVLVDPSTLPQADYLVCESTYGGRFHSSNLTLEQKLIDVITHTCIKTPGRLIIPAFSIGRTQSLIFTLNKLFSSGKIPRVQVFVDSPLANFATEIYRKYHHLVNNEAKAFYQAKGDEFEFENLDYTQNLNDSKQINSYHDACIIISSAGMLEGGRIQDHIYNNIQNYYCTILFIGYCAKGTLGDRLLRGDPIVRLRNRDMMVYAKIDKTDLLSGHADHNDLMEVITSQDKTRLKKVFLVHGDIPSLKALAQASMDAGYATEIAEPGFTYQL